MNQMPLTPIARLLRRRALLACGSLLTPLGALAGPTGADVVSGQVGISTPGAGGLVIDQTSSTAIINWQEFSIGNGEYVLFNQPSASAAVLNRVVGGLPSDILGDLTASGRVFLINPQGILFGAGSRIDVGALVATTHDISDEDFLSGSYVFAGSSTAGVTNAGNIRTGDGGFVILTADHVSNGGTIEAPNGDVVLAAGRQLSMQLDAEGLVSVGIDAAAVSDLAGVDNAGEIVANGGAVLLRADVARGLLASAVNSSGRISAQAIEERGGEIYLVASGGDVVNSGALDASGQAGSAGGTVTVASDRNVVLGSGSSVDASGARGGTVLAIADGVLEHQAGAHIDVSGAGVDSGGTVELSGHERVRIAGSVDLGSGGHLLIDPATMTIGDGPGVDMTTATLETLLQSNDRTSTIQIVATDSITIEDLGGDNTVNGVNTSDSTKGASLTLEIGACSTTSAVDCGGTITQGAAGSIFIKGTNDRLDIAGDISIIGGYSGGQVNVSAQLASGGDIHVEGYDGVDVANDINADGSIYVYSNDGISLGGATTAGRSIDLFAVGSGTANVGIGASGPISAVGSVYVQSNGGTISLADVSVAGDETGSASPDAAINIDHYGTSGADITTGTLTATAGQGRATIDVYTGNGSVHVADGIVAAGGGFDDSYSYGGNLAAQVALRAYNGTLDVDGDVEITGIAINSTSNCCGDSYSTSYGDASLYAYAGSINFDGAVSVTGNGGASVEAYTGTLAGDGITFGSALTVFADAAVENIAYADGSHVHRHFGQAEVYLSAYSGTITTHGVDVSGPNAYFNTYADRVVMNADGNGQSLSVFAPQGGAGNTLGSYFEYRDAGNQLLASSSYGVARAHIGAGGGDGSTPSIFAGGDIEVAGPSAALSLQAAFGISVDGDLDVAGQGYLIDGDWSLINYEHAPYNYGYGFDALQLGGSSTGDPLLSTGSSAWGAAALQISGYGQLLGGEVVLAAVTPISFVTPAGDVLIGGDVSVSGQGSAVAALAASGLGVGGDVSVHADAGFLAGTVESVEYVVDQYYDVVRQIGGALATEGVTGSAQHGEARFYFDSATSGTTLDIGGQLAVSGNSAGIEIAHAGDAHLGSIQLLGGTGGNTPRYAEVATYTPQSGGPALDPYVTTVVGDANVLDVGFDADGRPANLTIDSNVQVRGTGLVAAVLLGDSVTVGGTIGVQHVAGAYDTNNPAYAPPPPDFAAAVLHVAATDAPAAIGGINANVDGTLALGLDVDASGNTLLQADTLTQTLSGAYRDFAHPASIDYPDSGSPDLVFTPLAIEANSITLGFNTDSTLEDAALLAHGTLSVNGTGATLLAGVVDWSGGAINVSNTVVEADAFTLTGSGTIGNSTLDAGSGALTLSGAQWTINNTVLSAGGVTFDSAQTILIQNTAIIAASVDAVATHSIGVIAGELEGQTLLLQTTNAAGDGILVDQSALLFSDAITIGSASTTTLEDSLVGDFPSTLAAKAAGSTAIDVHASGALVVSASHLAGDAVVLDAASQALSGIIDGNHVTLTSGSAIAATTAGLEINAGTLDVVGQSIDLAHSVISVGSGLADNGHDPTMLQLLAEKAPDLVPASSAPNAAFIAEDGVQLGALTVAGGYLFVQAPLVAAVSISAPGDFFYNYRPFADEQAIELTPGTNFDVGGSTTLAFGGSGYLGNVDVVIEELMLKATDSANYVLLTQGELRDLDRIGTTGQVVVLGGTVIRAPREGSPEDEAYAAIVLTNGLGEKLIAEKTGDEGGDPDYGDGAQIDIVSGGADDLICQ